MQPDVGLHASTLRSRPELKPRVGYLKRLSHPGILKSYYSISDCLQVAIFSSGVFFVLYCSLSLVTSYLRSNDAWKPQPPWAHRLCWGLAGFTSVLHPRWAAACGLGSLQNPPELQLLHLQNQDSNNTYLLVLLGGLSDRTWGKCGAGGLARRNHSVNVSSCRYLIKDDDTHLVILNIIDTHRYAEHKEHN